jgi:ubiquinone/menaquinone biosynthesis C-methylase UbiE
MEDRKYFERHDITEEELVKIFNSKDYFAGNASNWGTSQYTKKEFYMDWHLQLAQQIVDRYNPKSCLDVGCGIGFTVAALQHLKVKAMGMDVSEWAITHAVAAPWHLRLFVGDIFDIPFGDKSWDLVITHDVLEHIPVDLLPKALAELERVGRHNYHFIPFGQKSGDGDITHVTMKDETWWRNIIPKKDFDIIETW